METKLKHIVRTVWANPVVLRDLRVRLRGAKSFWFQAIYLALLGLLCMLGYATTVARSSVGGHAALDPINAQASLQGFYYFIFMTLAAMVTLIAPALTAVSITTERQQLSLDLLVTTPLSAAELLVGKMVSSIAFLLLLLVLSVPASAICVILGGATFADVLQVYFLLLIDGVLLSAIGLAMSCATRASLPALVWTYLTVGALMVPSGLASSGAFIPGPVHTPLEGLAVFGCLNPFVSVILGTKSILIWTHEIPVCFLVLPLALVLIRLFITAATYRLGRYGEQAIPSLRRQIIFISGAAVFAGCYFAGPVLMMTSPVTLSTDLSRALLVALTTLFAVSCLLLPSLMTAVQADDDDPPSAPIVGVYSLKDAFKPVHRGALPFYHVWVIAMAGCVAAGLLLGGIQLHYFGTMMALCVLYLSSLGYLFWCIGRRCGAILGSISGARGMTFALFAVLAWAPLALSGILLNGTEIPFATTVVAKFWIFRPLAELVMLSPSTHAIDVSILETSLLCYVLGTLIYLPWKNVEPGRVRERKVRIAQPAQS